MPVGRGIWLIFIVRMFGAHVLSYSDRTMVLGLPLNVAGCSAMTTILHYVSAQHVGLISHTNHKASFQDASVRSLYVTCPASYYEAIFAPA